MEPTRTAKPEMYIVGVEVRTRNVLEADPATAKIAGLWNNFFQQNLAGKISNRKDPDSMLGVYTNYESDHAGFYTLIAGTEVKGLTAIPAGMVGMKVPAAEYLVFAAPGKLPQAIIAAWKNIWNYFSPGAACQRSYTTDFELYRTNPGSGGENTAEIYIAVE